MNMSGTLLTAAVAVFIYVNIIHLVALIRKDNGIMDADWGGGFIVITLLTFIFSKKRYLRIHQEEMLSGAVV